MSEVYYIPTFSTADDGKTVLEWSPVCLEKAIAGMQPVLEEFAAGASLGFHDPKGKQALVQVKEGTMINSWVPGEDERTVRFPAGTWILYRDKYSGGNTGHADRWPQGIKVIHYFFDKDRDLSRTY